MVDNNAKHRRAHDEDDDRPLPTPVCLQSQYSGTATFSTSDVFLR